MQIGTWRSLQQSGVLQDIQMKPIGDAPIEVQLRGIETERILHQQTRICGKGFVQAAANTKIIRNLRERRRASCCAYENHQRGAFDGSLMIRARA